jgi:hypothetical protein
VHLAAGLKLEYLDPDLQEQVKAIIQQLIRKYGKVDRRNSTGYVTETAITPDIKKICQALRGDDSVIVLGEFGSSLNEAAKR